MAPALRAMSFGLRSRLKSAFSFATRGMSRHSERGGSGRGGRGGGRSWGREGVLKVQGEVIVIVFRHFPDGHVLTTALAGDDVFSGHAGGQLMVFLRANEHFLSVVVLLCWLAVVFHTDGHRFMSCCGWSLWMSLMTLENWSDVGPRAGWDVFGRCHFSSLSLKRPVRGRRTRGSLRGQEVLIVLFFCLLHSLFLCCFLEEGLNGTRLFACGVLFYFRGRQVGRPSGGWKALSRTDVTAQETTDSPCWWSVGEFAGRKVEQGERWSPEETVENNGLWSFVALFSRSTVNQTRTWGF